MTQNIGKIDQIIRMILGIVIAIWGFYTKNWWGLIALVPLLTAFIRFCPFYPLLGIRTNKEK
ncbi:DUF2892 domain-containing protein [Candidatus Sulfidibacterium hydrothermale]|uniref:YgaP family membrane protein n=1 Tax=Candidatus Sulfidibacterium hydrothermale TaxID=2875962 RepID=UPI001F0A83E6|nr:DUF2892 domain-containing protein [Candidatus Sulfidibacterium hydrothermale]UBM61617.1 DUF2892 domain-containing protein [Candidatus Sulfidibacterium hydrothermale]